MARGFAKGHADGAAKPRLAEGMLASVSAEWAGLGASTLDSMEPTPGRPMRAGVEQATAQPRPALTPPTYPYHTARRKGRSS